MEMDICKDLMAREVEEDDGEKREKVFSKLDLPLGCNHFFSTRN